MSTLSLKGFAAGGAGTVVLLHAFPLSADMWTPQIAALQAAGFDVVAPQVYGIEGSPEKPGWSMDDYAHDLARLLESLGCQKATIVGLSMGGYQAFAFYRLYPEKTASLVLCDTRANSDAPEAKAARMEFRRAVEELGPAEAARRMLPNFFAQETVEHRPELVGQMRSIIESQQPMVISEAMRAIAERPDSTGMLPSVTCPVLLLNGEKDCVTTPETAASMHRLIPGSRLELLPGSGHLSNLEQPELFNQLLLRHIKSL